MQHYTLHDWISIVRIILLQIRRNKRISSKPNMTRRFISLFVVVLLIIKDVNGVINNGPSNAVVEVGGQAVFNCTSGTTLQNWIFARSRDDLGTSSAQDIAINCVIQPGFETHYEVDRPGGSNNICNLIVNVITMQQAGLYTCSDSSTGPSAILTVIDSPSAMAINNTADTIEKESVVFECSLNYNGSVSSGPTLRPHYYWTYVNGQNVSDFVENLTENELVSNLSVTAGRQDIAPYTCHLYLKLDPPVNGGYANNTPTVNHSASSPPIAVLYPPLISNISSERRNATSISCEFSTFTCDATANPAVNFSWSDLEEPDRVIADGQSLEYAEFGRNYSCNATNIIRSEPNTDTEMHEETDYDSAIPSCKGCRNSAMHITGDTCTGTKCSCLFSCDMTVICTADAYPEPTYQWMRTGEITASNNTLDAVADGTYTCVAKNVIDGHTFEGRIEIKVENCYADTITLIVLMIWFGVCTVVVCVMTIFYGGFKHIMDCCFPFLCTKLESNKCVNVVWNILFLLTSCFASGVVVALTTCLCFKDGAKTKADQGSIGTTSSNKHSKKPLIILAISSILFVIDLTLWIVAGVGMSSCM